MFFEFSNLFSFVKLSFMLTAQKSHATCWYQTFWFSTSWTSKSRKVYCTMDIKFLYWQSKCFLQGQLHKNLLLIKQQVLMQLPVVSSSFTEANKFSIHQLSSNIVPAVQTSYAISASNMVANKNIQFFNIVVDFSHTGEQLTNTVL